MENTKADIMKAELLRAVSKAVSKAGDRLKKTGVTLGESSVRETTVWRNTKQSAKASFMFRPTGADIMAVKNAIYLLLWSEEAFVGILVEPNNSEDGPLGNALWAFNVSNFSDIPGRECLVEVWPGDGLTTLMKVGH